MGSKAPDPPDPQKVAQAQQAANVETAREQAKLNAVDQFGPFGSTVYQRDSSGVPIAQQVNLNPEVQNILDQQFDLSGGLGQASLDALNYLPQDKFTIDQFTSQVGAPDPNVDYGLPQDEFQLDVPDTSDISQTYFDQQMGLLRPEFEDQNRQFEATMSDRGLPVGSTVFDETFSDLKREQNLARQQAADQAVFRGLQEQQRQIGNQFGVRGQNVQEAQLRGREQGQEFGQSIQAGQFDISEQQRAIQNALAERSQPYQDLAALGAVTPGTQLPQFQNAPQTAVANTDIIGPTYQSYNAQVQNANAMNKGLFGLGSAIATPLIGMLSDERTKENRKPADGEMVLALLRDMPAEDYDYKEEAREALNVPESRTGVMAQDYAEKFGGDGKTIDLPDFMGKLLASIQALDKRTQGMAEA